MHCKTSKTLSKSKLKLQNQCAKLLYLEVNHPELKQISKKDATVFIVGREVESVARSQFPNGHLVDKEKNTEKRNQTLEFLKSFPNDPIFEASFIHDNVHIQIDVLKPKPDGTYKAIEVKSSSKLKDEYLEDTAIQFHVVEGSGLIKISEYEVWFINTQSETEDIFTREPVLDLIIPMKEYVDSLRSKAQSTIDLDTAPDVSVGRHCDKPYGCPFKHLCWKAISEKPDHILHLPFLDKKKWDLNKQGIFSFKDERFNSKDYGRPEILEAIDKGEIYINAQGILDELATWKAPYHFFDFEALMHFRSFFAGTRPYESVPIQYSLHQLMSLDQKNFSDHKEWLHDSKENPKPDLIQKLIEDLGTEGSIITYNMTYEKTRIKDLIQVCNDEDLKLKLTAILDRFVDLMKVIEAYLYHPDFKGSFSLKVVSPTLLGHEQGGYTDSLIKSGSEISTYYIEFLTTTDSVRKEELRQAFLKYCGYDTLNLILLTQWIKDLALSKIIKAAA